MASTHPGAATASTTADALAPTQDATNTILAKPKLFGRAFYESIGSPKFVVAPMVDQSEFVRILIAFLHHAKK